MGYQPPTTIVETLRRIQSGELILPAIQREYVWRPSQVVALFDSLMRGYPIGGFLSWKVEPETVRQFRFYGFLKDYSEFDARHCPSLDVPPSRPVTAVLDGQQRLTSLNIGLRGTYAHRVSGGWRNNPQAYPTRRLYLNLGAFAPENEAGLIYDFRLLTEKQHAAARDESDAVWFPVSEIFEARESFDVWGIAAGLGLGDDAEVRRMLSRLWDAVHNRPLVHFYEETDQDVERVLDIFIRVNSGGTVLSYSDLLLSIATAQWKERDAREAIHGLVDNLNRTGAGFDFSQDVVLKAGLVLARVGDFAFRVKNFNAENMALLQREWDAIGESLVLAAELLSDFGLSDATLSADSVLIPVAYYVHTRGLTEAYRTRGADAADRASLRSWVLRSLVMPGVWGSGLDTLVRDLRDVLNREGSEGFPARAIEARMAALGKPLVLSDEQVEDILDLGYGRSRTFAVLAMLFPHVDTRNVHHVDHVFPRSLFHRSRLRDAGLSEEEIDDVQGKRDLLPNLQLLEGPTNIEKSNQLPAAWAADRYGSGEAYERYLDRHDLGWLPSSAAEFARFFDERRERLARRIRAVLVSQDGESVEVAAQARAQGGA
ncbi:DUF262 domain-containing protein [Cellulomonas bogoriensis]|uniref:GmrSD restriction endonucleases N-terminal domain-containing protein n=1 Tax=Cellulomonas bogoriensis 69B4 = DSM 16987 TaxID=1386082 RepID=A0A0A0C2L6_9CELL|nr:DUF262 domain-containing protein [Cellulomonas bogoriensis]KGM14430.1 hypothetical protein N869_11075 [Cellulomonas bogoriensis 69B4 = DSM 16987]